MHMAIKLRDMENYLNINIKISISLLLGSRKNVSGSQKIYNGKTC